MHVSYRKTAKQTAKERNGQTAGWPFQERFANKREETKKIEK